MNWRPSQSPEWQTAKHAAAYRAFPRRGVGRGSSQGAKGSVRTTLCQPPVRREAVIDSEFFLHWNPLFPSSPQIVRHCCISDSVDSVEQPWGQADERCHMSSGLECAMKDLGNQHSCGRLSN